MNTKTVSAEKPAPTKEGNRLAAGQPTGIATRIGTLVSSHAVNDFYTSLVPPLLAILEVRCHLSEKQSAWLLGIGSIVSGLSQPFFAWLSDRFQSKSIGSLGMAFCAIGMCLIGLASNYQTLIVVYVVGMIGAGMYHPVAAASIGALAGPRRSAGVSLFFVAGMAGAILGAYLAPRLVNAADGFDWFPYLMVPGLAFAVLMQWSATPITHVSAETASTEATRVGGRTWLVLAALYVVSAMRFTVNMSVIYLYTRWANEVLCEAVGRSGDWNYAAAVVGRMTAATYIGMAVGGLAAGSLVRPGREKGWLVATPLLLSSSIIAFPHCQPPVAECMAILAGIGFAAMVPVSVSLAQQLLPRRTSFASGMMLGGAWAVAVLGPVLGEMIRARYGVHTAFHATGWLLAASGLLLLPFRFSIPGR